VLQTLGSSQPYGSSELAFREDRSQGLDLRHYVGILKRRIFYFLIPFSLIASLGLYFAAIQKPTYLSEGKILVASQGIAPDIVRPIVTAAASERIQVIEQRIMTRDNLLSIASKFGLFPSVQQSATGLSDLMRQSTQIRPLDVERQIRQGASPIAFTVGFEYESPELAMRVASEFMTLILNEDAQTQTSRATETVKILENEVKGAEDKLDSIQMQLIEIKRRPRDAVPEAPDQEKSQLAALAALKAELIQRTSVYSDAHPTVTALKKRIAAVEKSITQSPQASGATQTTQADEIEALQWQRLALEKRLDDANGKLASARLSERLDRDQQSERLQIIESPPLPQRPVKSGRLKVVGIAFALAAMLGVGAVFAAEVLDGSIRGRHELSGVVDSHLIVSIPYIATRADVLRTRWSVILGAVTGVLIMGILGGLAAAIVFGLPADFSWFDTSWLYNMAQPSK
jgi:uncharacterized protein involved in exopolysaccharide biosynthesis